MSKLKKSKSIGMSLESNKRQTLIGVTLYLTRLTFVKPT